MKGEIRTKISQILLRWGLGTRQVAIIEITKLVADERLKLLEEVEETFLNVHSGHIELNRALFSALKRSVQKDAGVLPQ